MDDQTEQSRPPGLQDAQELTAIPESDTDDRQRLKRNLRHAQASEKRLAIIQRMRMLELMRSPTPPTMPRVRP